MREPNDWEIAPAGFVWCGRKGDLTLYLTHISQGDDDEAALYIRNENRKVDGLHPLTGHMASGCPAYLVRYADFWLYRPEDKDLGRWHTQAEVEGRLANAAAALYGLDAQPYRNRIRDAILEFADDVKNLRPPPGRSREQWLDDCAKAGLTLKVNGKALN